MVEQQTIATMNYAPSQMYPQAASMQFMQNQVAVSATYPAQMGMQQQMPMYYPQQGMQMSPQVMRYGSQPNLIPFQQMTPSHVAAASPQQAVPQPIIINQTLSVPQQQQSAAPQPHTTSYFPQPHAPPQQNSTYASLNQATPITHESWFSATLRQMKPAKC